MSQRSDYEFERTTGAAIRISFAIAVAFVFLAIALLVAP
jgi:hypothetical protein